MEDESDESDGEDKDPSYTEVPGTSADDQAGPSGVGKDGVEAPSQRSKPKEVLRSRKRPDYLSKQLAFLHDRKSTAKPPLASSKSMQSLRSYLEFLTNLKTMYTAKSKEAQRESPKPDSGANVVGSPTKVKSQPLLHCRQKNYKIVSKTAKAVSNAVIGKRVKVNVVTPVRATSSFTTGDNAFISKPARKPKATIKPQPAASKLKVPQKRGGNLVPAPEKPTNQAKAVKDTSKIRVLENRVVYGDVLHATAHPSSAISGNPKGADENPVSFNSLSDLVSVQLVQTPTGPVSYRTYKFAASGQTQSVASKTKNAAKATEKPSGERTDLEHPQYRLPIITNVRSLAPTATLAPQTFAGDKMIRWVRAKDLLDKNQRPALVASVPENSNRFNSPSCSLRRIGTLQPAELGRNIVLKYIKISQNSSIGNANFTSKDQASESPAFKQAFKILDDVVLVDDTDVDGLKETSTSSRMADKAMPKPASPFVPKPIVIKQMLLNSKGLDAKNFRQTTKVSHWTSGMKPEASTASLSSNQGISSVAPALQVVRKPKHPLNSPAFLNKTPKASSKLMKVDFETAFMSNQAFEYTEAEHGFLFEDLPRSFNEAYEVPSASSRFKQADVKVVALSRKKSNKKAPIMKLAFAETGPLPMPLDEAPSASWFKQAGVKVASKPTNKRPSLTKVAETGHLLMPFNEKPSASILKRTVAKAAAHSSKTTNKRPSLTKVALAETGHFPIAFNEKPSASVLKRTVAKAAALSRKTTNKKPSVSKPAPTETEHLSVSLIETPSASSRFKPGYVEADILSSKVINKESPVINPGCAKTEHLPMCLTEAASASKLNEVDALKEPSENSFRSRVGRECAETERELIPEDLPTSRAGASRLRQVDATKSDDPRTSFTSPINREPELIPEDLPTSRVESREAKTTSSVLSGLKTNDVAELDEASIVSPEPTNATESTDLEIKLNSSPKWVVFPSGSVDAPEAAITQSSNAKGDLTSIEGVSKSDDLPESCGTLDKPADAEDVLAAKCPSTFSGNKSAAAAEEEGDSTSMDSLISFRLYLSPESIEGDHTLISDTDESSSSSCSKKLRKFEDETKKQTLLNELKPGTNPELKSILVVKLIDISQTLAGNQKLKRSVSKSPKSPSRKRQKLSDDDDGFDEDKKEQGKQKSSVVTGNLKMKGIKQSANFPETCCGIYENVSNSCRDTKRPGTAVASFEEASEDTSSNVSMEQKVEAASSEASKEPEGLILDSCKFSENMHPNIIEVESSTIANEVSLTSTASKAKKSRIRKRRKKVQARVSKASTLLLTTDEADSSAITSSEEEANQEEGFKPSIKKLATLVEQLRKRIHQ